MCSGCGFFISVPASNPTALDFLQNRFQRRCPTLLFALADSDCADELNSADIRRQLAGQGHSRAHVESVLSHFPPDDRGRIHGEDLRRLCALAQTADTDTIASAVRLVDPRRRVALQLSGTVIQPWGAAPPSQWHEQARNESLAAPLHPRSHPTRSSTLPCSIALAETMNAVESSELSIQIPVATRVLRSVGRP